MRMSINRGTTSTGKGAARVQQQTGDMGMNVLRVSAGRGLALATLAAVLTTAPAGAQAEVQFLDHRSKLIVLESPPQKIVSMFASGPLVHYAVEGRSDHIAGVNKKAKAMYEGSFYAQLIPEFLKLNMNVAGDG